MNNSDWLSLFVGRSKGSDENAATDVTSESGLATTQNSITAEPTVTNEHEANDVSSSEMASTSQIEVEVLSSGEKYVYEAQLEQLQEQLVDIMIQNQEMTRELEVLKAGDVCKLGKELEREQSKRRQLEDKLGKIKSDDTPKLRRRRKPTNCDFLMTDGASPDDNLEKKEESCVNPCESQPVPATDTLIEEPRSRFQKLRRFISGWYLSISETIVITVLDILSDLNDDEALSTTEDIDGAPLAVKTLKDNIKRFSNGIKPISEFFKKINWILSWKNPAATMLIFLVYIFSFWHGYTISLLLFLAIVQLSANFVYNKFGSVPAKEEIEVPPEAAASWSDRFQIVVHVARKVQNVLGMLSDYCEKIKNLFTWRVTHVTLKLYIVLWLLLCLSLLLKTQQFFTLIGLALGYKLFIQGPLFIRFPKLKRKYDTTLRLWNELPVDVETDDQNIESQNETSVEVNSEAVGNLSELTRLNSRLFCERYKLTTDEMFVKGWEDGWRTSLMNKANPLVNIRHGRLYLTQNYLCFERSKTSLEKNILMKISDMRCVNKYKPLFILPGSGMSIEVCMKDKDEPYIFAAIIGRDDAYNDIIQTAKQVGLPWAR